VNELNRTIEAIKRNHEKERAQWAANKQCWKDDIRQRDLEILRLKQFIASLYNTSRAETDTQLRARGVERTLHMDREMVDAALRLMRSREER
jgi:hypothetical protein